MYLLTNMCLFHGSVNISNPFSISEKSKKSFTFVSK